MILPLDVRGFSTLITDTSYEASIRLLKSLESSLPEASTTFTENICCLYSLPTFLASRVWGLPRSRRRHKALTPQTWKAWLLWLSPNTMTAAREGSTGPPGISNRPGRTPSDFGTACHVSRPPGLQSPPCSTAKPGPGRRLGVTSRPPCSSQEGISWKS